MEIPTQVHIVLPEWIRRPKDGTYCQWFGLTRDMYYRLMREEAIRAVSLCVHGKSRGIRLINYRSVSVYLADLEDRATASSAE